MRTPVTVSGTIEQRIAELADRQRGRVSREQLRSVDVGDRVISRMLANETLRAVRRGVYVYGHAADVEFGAEVAALLACGFPSWLTDVSAAVAWRMLPPPAGPVHVVVAPSRPRRSRQGVTVHRTRSLTPADATTTLGLPVTTPEYTLLALADRHPARRVERVLDEALGLRITSRTKIRTLLSRSNGHHGLPLLARLIDPQRPSSITKSKPEEDIRAAFRSIAIEQPAHNTSVHGFECDLHFARAGVVVEIQSFRWHNNRFTFAKDHRKRKALERAGLVVMPFMADEVEHNLVAVVAEIVQTVTRRTLEAETKQSGLPGTD